VLLAAGINIHARNDEAITWAKDAANTEIIKLLEDFSNNTSMLSNNFTESFSLKGLQRANLERTSCIKCSNPLQNLTLFSDTVRYCKVCEDELC
jgi:hypothetical protein